MSKGVSLDLVVKSNDLNEVTLYKKPLELKIFAKVICEIRANPNAEYYKIQVKDLLQSVHLSKTSYTIAKETAFNMISVSIKKEHSKGLMLSNIFTDIDIHKEGIIIFYINKRVFPHLLELSHNFTTYHLENIAKLKGKNSIRMYELLKQYQNDEGQGWWKVSLVALREMLGLKISEYKAYKEFKRSILIKCEKELKQHTDVAFTFGEERVGRSVETILFRITKNKNSIKKEKKIDIVPQPKITPKVENIKYKNEILKVILEDELCIPNKNIELFLSSYDEIYILQTAEYIKELVFTQKKDIRDITAFTMTALKENYLLSRKKSSQNILKENAHLDAKHQKEKQEAKKIQQIQQSKKSQNEYEEHKKRLIVEFVTLFPKVSMDLYEECRIKNIGTFTKLPIVKDIEALSVLLRGEGSIGISAFRHTLYTDKIPSKNKISFEEFTLSK